MAGPTAPHLSHLSTPRIWTPWPLTLLPQNRLGAPWSTSHLWSFPAPLPPPRRPSSCLVFPEAAKPA